MAAFEQGDVIRVPFPYTDKNTRQHRPALIISARPVGDNAALLWVAMITSADNRSWPRDVPIRSYRASGLPAPSAIRCAKIATIETRHAERIGAINNATLGAVMQNIRDTMFG